MYTNFIRLRTLRSRSCNRVPSRFASSSSIATKQPSPGLGGLLGWLTGDRSSLVPPLDFPLSNINLPPTLLDYAPGASIGLYVNCGSIYETPLTFGATHLLERMAFKSTRNRSHFRVVHELLKVKADIGEASKNPQDLLLEAIHSAGFSGALANPLLASESAINGLNGTILEEFVVENYTAPRIVLAASGVEHEDLLSIAEPLLCDLPSGPYPEESKLVYTSGDYRCQTESGMLLGGGGSFSAGGPGKGMYSRLFHSISAFNNIYNNTGIFGIQVTTGSDFVSEAVDIAANELLAVATSGKDGCFRRYRQISIDIWKPTEDFLKAVDGVTLKGIKLSPKLISSPLTMASYGDVIYVPSYDSVSSKFSSKSGCL
ncbi:unnamed protein product [Lupinus luteus]|uniref:Uncharacterized protein n=1 Tax=Lupinus luteus TaxID=3873 RepID=A0AAV1WTD8_LUPLU